MTQNFTYQYITNNYERSSRHGKSKISESILANYTGSYIHKALVSNPAGAKTVRQALMYWDM